MVRLMTAGFAAALAVVQTQAAARQAADRQVDDGLIVRAVRFYRADQKQTRVKAFAQIPLSAIAPVNDSVRSGAYTVSVKVADSTGLTLLHQNWVNRVSAGAGSRDQYAVEIVDFAVAPGRYDLVVDVKDSISGRSLSASVPVTALSDTARASDLLISPEIRTMADTAGGPRPGEFRAGNNLIIAAAEVTLTPLRPKLFYLMEAYANAEDAGTLTATVADSAGAKVLQTASVPITVAAGGSIVKGQLDLSGLPAGQFTMTAELKLKDRTVRRSGTFTMEPLGESLARDSARKAVAREGDDGYFAEMTNEQLEQAKAPLGYIAEGRELSAWDKKLSLAAKRQFLTNFWAARDPSPGTLRNERRESFYAAIDYANRTYREGGRKAVPGWKADRGRIYARNGKPDELYQKQQEGRAPPYQVWRYASGKGLYYIFADRTGFGAFTLIFSNDIREPNLPSWGTILGGPAVQDISQWLGIDLMTTAAQSQ
ncbi:MAG TPA: GWxTD domain-containing protein [Gemmatimonadales bacterium]|nr:GWxTD domain-containing protein [Gemmatimonadales bacterium]